MGVEFFLLLIIVIVAAIGFFVFSGSYGIARSQRDPSGDAGRGDGQRPTHVYVENETAARSPGDDGSAQERRAAESDPATEVRGD